jgi:hypothetical protein
VTHWLQNPQLPLPPHLHIGGENLLRLRSPVRSWRCNNSSMNTTAVVRVPTCTWSTSLGSRAPPRTRVSNGSCPCTARNTKRDTARAHPARAEVMNSPNNNACEIRRTWVIRDGAPQSEIVIGLTRERRKSYRVRWRLRRLPFLSTAWKLSVSQRLVLKRMLLQTLKEVWGRWPQKEFEGHGCRERHDMLCCLERSWGIIPPQPMPVPGTWTVAIVVSSPPNNSTTRVERRFACRAEIWMAEWPLNGVETSTRGMKM